MAIPSADRKSVTVEYGDTLSQIAYDYLGDANKYHQLAAINNISNPDLIYVDQVIKLTNDGGGSSGGSSSTTSATSTSSNKPTIDHFGHISTEENMLFATWTWNKDHTASYKVLWTYNTGDGVWFTGSNSTISVDKDAPELSRQSTYSIPSNARQVRFKVKPISETYKSNDEDVNYWEASWSDVRTYIDGTPLAAPDTPSVVIEKYKLTATLDNIKVTGATGIQFEIVKDNKATPFKTGKATIITNHASYSCSVDAGGEYKVRCRAYNDSFYGDWSGYSNNEGTIPAAIAGITDIRATSKTAIYLEWEDVTAEGKTYDVEYSTKKEYFDNTDQTTTKSGIEFTHFEFVGLESGEEYFFRVRATNSEGSSAWSEIKSVVIGKEPIAPTTWSSTTTAMVGEDVNLYWVHNSEDGSSQLYAEVELTINGNVLPAITIKNTTDEEKRDKTSFCIIDTGNQQGPVVKWTDDDGEHSSTIVDVALVDGCKIQWRVRTCGITRVYGDWSTQRSIDIHAPVTLELSMTDKDGDPLTVLTSFPFYIKGLPGPSTQSPLGYHLTVTSNEAYETTDNVGNPIVINAGQQVYSNYFDTKTDLLVEFSANNIDLENNIEYTIACVVSMDTGLTREESITFRVSWDEILYEPNAAISLDEDSMSAYIRPYCVDGRLVRYRVTKSSETYTKTDTSIGSVYGTVLPGVQTTTGELVYSGVTADGEEVYYCNVEETTPVENVWLSVYRREFDGRFTELAAGLDGAKATTITDPHPALDYARYRIVAAAKDTGAISYYDPPGYPVNGKAVIIQWDEAWTSFETTEEAALELPPWSGSLLKLPYNIDVSDNNKSDVALIEYIGRSHPISYYGTQLGQTATWNVTIRKDDEETLYALRRLAKWMGDVYVREPSGSGYWANVTVSFSQKHLDLTIPVTLDVVRVEGGI